MNDEGARRRRWRWIPWRTGLVVAAVAIALNTWVVQTVKVTTGSMQPFLHGDPDNGDRVVVNKTAYRWGEEPERFDIFRPHKAHMAFAFGPHRCLGVHLATMETRVVLDRLFERLPKLRLDPEAEDVHITGMAFRSPLELPVRFD